MKHLKVVGKTEGGDLVVGNVFTLFDRYGLPFEVIFDALQNNNYVVAWRCLYNEARSYGWSWSTLRKRLSETINDSYGSEYRDVVLDNLEKYNQYIEENYDG